MKVKLAFNLTDLNPWVLWANNLHQPRAFDEFRSLVPPALLIFATRTWLGRQVGGARRKSPARALDANAVTLAFSRSCSRRRRRRKLDEGQQASSSSARRPASHHLQLSAFARSLADSGPPPGFIDKGVAVSLRDNYRRFGCRQRHRGCDGAAPSLYRHRR